MSLTVSLAARIRDDERGAGYLAAFIVLFSMLGVAGVGILVDGARIVSAERQCTSIALEAARAGANALDPIAVRSGGVLVDPADAQAAASTAAASFVAGSGASLQSVTVNGNRVTVRVSASRRLVVPDDLVTHRHPASLRRRRRRRRQPDHDNHEEECDDRRHDTAHVQPPRHRRRRPRRGGRPVLSPRSPSSRVLLVGVPSLLIVVQPRRAGIGASDAADRHVGRDPRLPRPSADPDRDRPDAAAGAC